MNPALTHLVVDISAIKPEHMLQCWTWLVSPSHVPILASAVGDLFLRAPDGSVLWLNVGAGTSTRVATTSHEFTEALGDPERATEWLCPELVAILERRLGALGRNQCYSFKIPPTLSGSYDDPGNYERCDLVTHLGVLGQVQEQTLNLPEGTVIAGVKDVTPKSRPWWKLLG